MPVEVSQGKTEVSFNVSGESAVLLNGHSYAGRAILPFSARANWIYNRHLRAFELYSVEVTGSVVNADGKPGKNDATRAAFGYARRGGREWFDGAPDWLKTAVINNAPLALGVNF